MQKHAFDTLGKKSAMVKKAVSPRQAYKYKRVESSNLQFNSKIEDVKTPVEQKTQLSVYNTGPKSPSFSDRKRSMQPIGDMVFLF